MNILLWIIFGGLAGWLGSIITGDEASLGIIGNIAVGIIGAFIGGWIADKLSGGSDSGADRPTSIAGFIAAVVGAAVLLLILNFLFGLA